MWFGDSDDDSSSSPRQRQNQNPSAEYSLEAVPYQDSQHKSHPPYTSFPAEGPSPVPPAHYLRLRSGLPFPCHSDNPERGFFMRWSQVPGVEEPCEHLTAPRVRLAPLELETRGRVLQAVRRRAEADRHLPPQTASSRAAAAAELLALRRDAAAAAAGMPPTANGLAVADDGKNIPTPSGGAPGGVRRLNLSYQSLGDPYQKEALRTTLALNPLVEILALTDNSLTDLAFASLPHVRQLYLSRNAFTSCLQLPALPQAHSLWVCDCHIVALDGLETARFPSLRRLWLQGNTIARTPGYRAAVRRALPALDELDGVRFDRQ
eukprot:TRINITY_DN25149_c0_g1_i1.p1 TRINITY_DN25149_c0_g1~~TRINITY_DN25149_c0_g1_i1.p1  ORF type:complete len:360 (-),score=35.24 TRINITY_DN25149_c0_g1_i1:204-1163(-)